MKNKVVLFLLIACTFLVFVGCAPKDAITSDMFEEKAIELELTISPEIENTIQFMTPYSNNINAMTNEGFALSFFEFESNEDAKEAFDIIYSYLDSSKGTVSNRLQSNLPDSDFYLIATKGKVSIASRIKNTLIFSESGEENKKSMENYFKELGYA